MNPTALRATAAAVALALALAAPAFAADIPAHIAAAVAEPTRPAADTARDAARKPGEMLAFAGVKPGQTVVDFLPGGGYFTRVFSKAVGPQGTVYALVPAAGGRDAMPAAGEIAKTPGYGNIKPVEIGAAGFAIPTQADVIWTAQNYHDLHLTRIATNIAGFNAQLYAALRPGGVLVIVDHAALPGAPAAATADTLHRIDPEIVKREVAAAGFKLEAESEVLRNPADPKTKGVFDPSVQGKTDQFVLRFRKPG